MAHTLLRDGTMDWSLLDRILSWKQVNREKWDAAVDHLRTFINEADRSQLVDAIRRDGPRMWKIRNHFPMGMQVRNALLTAGYNEAALSILDLDNAWGYLLFDALDRSLLIAALEEHPAFRRA